MLNYPKEDGRAKLYEKKRGILYGLERKSKGLV